MGLPTFIRLENSLEEALKYYDSPQMTAFSFAGVHLLPNFQYPYKQRSYAAQGIELEDIGAVYVCDLCGNRLFDISNYFSVPNTFNDPDTGLPQIIWSLNNVDFDSGFRLIYLEIQSGANGWLYTSPFMLTHSREEYTSTWYYRDTDGTGLRNIYLGIGLVMYYRQRKSTQELVNYTPVATGTPLTATSRILAFERWNTGVIEINFIEEFKRLFEGSDVYALPQNFDGLPVKTGLNEPVETPDLEADENFAESELLLVRDYSAEYDPNAVPVNPPVPVPPIPEVTLTQLERVSASSVRYYFSYANFTTEPTYFIFQWSLDQVSWNNNTLGITSPAVVSGMATDPDTANYYYRIYHMASSTYSNILQLPAKAIVITNMVSPDGNFVQTGNKYSVVFTLNYAPTVQLSFEASTNGTDWYYVYYNNGNISPKIIQTPSSGLEFTYFRIKDNAQGLISNVYEFEF